MLEQVTSAADDFVSPGGSHFPSIMSTTATPSPTANVSSSQSHSVTALALGISLAVVATTVFGGLAFYFVRRRMWQKKAQERAEEISSHRRTYMVSVEPSHLAVRVTPFGVGVNAPDVEVPKLGESPPERAFLPTFPHCSRCRTRLWRTCAISSLPMLSLSSVADVPRLCLARRSTASRLARLELVVDGISQLGCNVGAGPHWARAVANGQR